MPVERVTFVITAQNQADVLARVVLLFHRLNVEIEWMHLARRRGTEMMRLSIRVTAESEHACGLEAQPYKIAARETSSLGGVASGRLIFYFWNSSSGQTLGNPPLSPFT